MTVNTVTQLWAVRAGLKRLFDAALADHDTVVWDGPRTHGQLPKRFLVIGTDGGDDGSGQGSLDTSGSRLAPSSSSTTGGREETGVVTCALWRWAGAAKDMPAMAVDAEQLFTLCAAAIAGDRTVAGALDVNDDGAYVSAVRITEQQTEHGPLIRVAFDITYTALLT